MTLAISVGLLIGSGIYLMMRREMLRIALGFTLLSHGVNLLIISAGGTSWRDEPFGAHVDTSTAADPLPQAFVLTAIVISFSISVLMFVTAAVGRKNDATRSEVDEDAAADIVDNDEDDDDYGVGGIHEGAKQGADNGADNKEANA